MRRHALSVSNDPAVIALVRGAFAETRREGDRVDPYPAAKLLSKHLGDITHIILDLASPGAATIGVRYLRKALAARPELRAYAISRLPNAACLPENLRDKVKIVTKNGEDENVTRRDLRRCLVEECATFDD